MTPEEAKANQDQLAKHYSLSHWYGTKCEKCCGVYPIHREFGSTVQGEMYYQCEVCGKRTSEFEMPWQAREAWNAGETFYEESQMMLF